MLVSRLVMPGGMVSWTVVGDDGLPVEPIECYLAHLARLERSPETVRGYAIGLKFFFDYLADRGLDWREAHVEDVARFVGWLRAPRQTSLSSRAALPGARSARSTITWLLCSAFMGSMPAQGSPSPTS